jgi:hypothetical protein
MQKDSSNFLFTDVSFSANNLLAVAISARVDLSSLGSQSTPIYLTSWTRSSQRINFSNLRTWSLVSASGRMET